MAPTGVNSWRERCEEGYRAPATGSRATLGNP